MHRNRLPSLILLLTLVALASWSVQGVSYTRYSGSAGCDDCHRSFGGPGAALHNRHTQMTSKCNLCHVSTGDNPRLNSSGGGTGCIGCHLQEGLRLHHAAAGAPADAKGMFCVSCHPNDPAPAPESTPPPYYARTDVALDFPCTVASASGGEDYDGDGKGLDNDGDLAYDGSDSDCSVPVRDSTWGHIKALYP